MVFIFYSTPLLFNFFWPKVMIGKGEVYFFNSFILNYNHFFCIPFTLLYLLQLQFSDGACKQRPLT
ncbi:hypothetical protein VCHA37P202_40032 [Vibrio chagasii]|nr:hypothetical protein VCHA37P202_40032 [Vibrio chagasii]CAH7404196.1 hypothetical protein VCHA49P380_70162 [Vibrio chagasii]